VRENELDLRPTRLVHGGRPVLRQIGDLEAIGHTDKDVVELPAIEDHFPKWHRHGGAIKVQVHRDELIIPAVRGENEVPPVALRGTIRVCFRSIVVKLDLTRAEFDLVVFGR
jgi:hypothetical protein